MPRRLAGLAPLALTSLLFGLPAQAEEPAASVPTTTTTTPSPDDLELQRALEAAAQADSQSAKGAKGADATLSEDRRAEDPLRLLLGKELIGNESNPSMSLILDFTAAWFSRQERIHAGGHAPSATGLAVTGAEFAATASVDPYFRFDLAFELMHLHLEEVTLTSLSLPWNLQVRAGKFLSKVGRHNATHPHSWHFVLHPLANQFLFGAEGLGAPGVEVSWLAPLPWFAELTAAVQSGEGGSFRTKPLTQGDPGLGDFLYPVRLGQFFDLADDWGLQLGLNAVFGTSAIGPEVGNRTWAYGADLVLKWRPIGAGSTGYTSVTWTTELWVRELEAPNDLWRDLGGYTDLVAGLGKRWEAGLRFELWRRLEGEAPTALNSRAQFGLNTLRGSATLAFLPSHFSRVRLQYTLEEVEGYAANHIALLQLEVSAGAHGAHAY